MVMYQWWVSVCFMPGRHKGSRCVEFPQHLRISRDRCLLCETKPFETIPYENVKLNTCFFFLFRTVILGVMFIIVWNSLLRKQDEDKMKIWKLTPVLDTALKIAFKKCSQLLSPRPPSCSKYPSVFTSYCHLVGITKFGWRQLL